MVAQDWLDGSYTEVYPNITRDKEGMQKLFKRFSFPGGIPSHVAPETPGSIHEGGELGYSLAHAFGAVADNPDLIAACVVGDGEAETGPLATGWQSNKLINPRTDGIVLPILHLGLPDAFQHHASREQLLAEAGLDADGIRAAVLARWPALASTAEAPAARAAG